jgi:hypothetical protein
MTKQILTTNMQILVVIVYAMLGWLVGTVASMTVLHISRPTSATFLDGSIGAVIGGAIYSLSDSIWTQNALSEKILGTRDWDVVLLSLIPAHPLLSLVIVAAITIAAWRILLSTFSKVTLHGRRH